MKVDLITITFSGASAFSYRFLEKYLPGFINVISLELPGRGRRISEPFLTDVNSMVDDIFHQSRTSLSSHYALFGHSLGALLGYLLIKRILSEELPPPIHAFFSGKSGPSTETKETPIHSLKTPDFIKKLREYKGTPEEILNDKATMDFFEPVLRADFQAIETYVYSQTTPFDVPITLMTGNNDDITCAEALNWQQETSKKMSLIQFPGNHFFILEKPDEVCKTIAGTLEKYINLT
ncbi:MAG: thioesterase II family protein [Candidatus Anammoxibacter sp.]